MFQVQGEPLSLISYNTIDEVIDEDTPCWTPHLLTHVCTRMQKFYFPMNGSGHLYDVIIVLTF